MRKTVLFRGWYYSGIKKLRDDERLEAYDAIMAHAFTGETLAVSSEIAPAINMILGSIDYDIGNYEKKKAEMG